MTCSHTRKRSIVLFLEPNQEKALPVAVITVRCQLCGRPLEFVGYTDSPGMVLSADRQELRVTITESLPGRRIQ